MAVEMGSALASGMQGLQKASEGLARNADAIAKNTGKLDATESLTNEMVESKQNLLHAQASAEVVKAADEVLGTLIDTVA